MYIYVIYVHISYPYVNKYTSLITHVYVYICIYHMYVFQGEMVQGVFRVQVTIPFFYFKEILKQIVVTLNTSNFIRCILI
jgi:hypothetical protein